MGGEREREETRGVREESVWREERGMRNEKGKGMGRDEYQGPNTLDCSRMNQGILSRGMGKVGRGGLAEFLIDV